MSVTKTLLQNQLTNGRLNASLHIRINGLSLNTSHGTCQKMCKSLIQHQGPSTHAKKEQHKAKEKWKSNISKRQHFDISNLLSVSFKSDSSSSDYLVISHYFSRQLHVQS